MTEEQIEKEAADYVRSTAVNQFDLTKAQAKFESWKAGYNFKDKLSGWVSVKERLPEDQQRVLAYGLGGRTVTAIFKEMGGAQYSVEDQSGNFLAYNYFSEDLDFAEEMTHWMPLPEPPK